MSTLTELFSSSPAQRIGWALIHFLWQGAAVALVLAVLLALLRRRSAQARWALSCAALALLAVLPVATALTVSVEAPGRSASVPTAGAAYSMTSTGVSVELPMGPASPPQPELAQSPQPAQAAPLPVQPGPTAPAERIAPVSWHRQLQGAIQPVLPWAILAWLAGVIVMSIWHFGGWLQVRRMRRLGTRAAGAVVQEMFNRILQRLGVRRPVRLLESVRMAVPAAVGWLRPVVLLPIGAVTGLTPRQLEAILAHELAHIRRWDCLVQALAAVTETLLFYHPAVWWVCRQIRQESEQCCDDLAVGICGDRRCYAHALAKVAELGARGPAFAAAATGGKLLPRIRRLLGAEMPGPLSFGRCLSGVLALVTIIAIAIAVGVSCSAEDALRAGDTASDGTDDGRRYDCLLYSQYDVKNGGFVGSTLVAAEIKDKAFQTRPLCPVTVYPFGQAKTLAVVWGKAYVVFADNMLVEVDLASGQRRIVTEKLVAYDYHRSGRLYCIQGERLVVFDLRQGAFRDIMPRPFRDIWTLPIAVSADEKHLAFPEPVQDEKWSKAQPLPGAKPQPSGLAEGYRHVLDTRLVIVDLQTGKQTRMPTPFSSPSSGGGRLQFSSPVPLAWQDATTVLVVRGDLAVNGQPRRGLAAVDINTGQMRDVLAIPGDHNNVPSLTVRQQDGQVRLALSDGRWFQQAYRIDSKAGRLSEDDQFGPGFSLGYAGRSRFLMHKGNALKGSEGFVWAKASPDGKRIAWSVDEQAGVGNPRKLRVYDLAASATQTLSDGFIAGVLTWVADDDLRPAQPPQSPPGWKPLATQPWPQPEERKTSDQPLFSDVMAIALSTEKPAYKHHEQVKLTVTLTNKTEKDLTFPRPGDHAFYLGMDYPDGGGGIDEFRSKDIFPTDPVVIKAGQQFQCTRTIEPYYLGKHVVTGQLKNVPSPWQGLLKPEPITFEVVESADSKDLLKAKFDRLMAICRKQYAASPPTCNWFPLAQLGPDAAGLLIRELEKSEDATFRNRIGYALVRMESPDALRFFARCLTGEAVISPSNAIEGLEGLCRHAAPRGPAIEVLVQAIDNPKAGIRSLAAETLTRIHDPKIKKAFEAEVSQEDSATAEKAARYLAAYEQLNLADWLAAAGREPTQARYLAANGIISKITAAWQIDEAQLPAVSWKEARDDPKVLEQFRKAVAAWETWARKNPSYSFGFFDDDRRDWPKPETGSATDPPATQPATRPAAGDLERLWYDLASSEPEIAGKAAAALIAAEESAVVFLKSKLAPPGATDAEVIKKLIAALDNSQYAVRRKARETLRELGTAAVPGLMKAGESPGLSAEAGLAIRALLEEINSPHSASPQARRMERVVSVLAGIGSESSKLLLKDLAGRGDNRQARLANAALVRLTAPVEMFGTVRDESGKVISGAEVSLYYHRSSWGFENRIVETVRTDQAGAFRFTRPLAFEHLNGTTYTDHYFILARHSDYALGWQLVLSGEEMPPRQLVLTSQAEQSFQVTDKAGKPLANTRVWLYGAGDRTDKNPHLRTYLSIPQDIRILGAATDAQGRVTLRNLPLTYLTLHCAGDGFAGTFINLGRPSAKLRQVKVWPAAPVSGVVRDQQGKPAAGAVVRFGADWNYNHYWLVRTDANGSYSVNLVPEGGSWTSDGGNGRYTVQLDHPRFTMIQRTVQTKPGTVTQVDIDAVPGTLIHGRVLEPGTDRPIPGARVQADTPSGRLNAYADSMGEFTWRAAAGPGTAFFVSPPKGFFVTGSGTVPQAADITGQEEMGLDIYAPGKLRALVAVRGKVVLNDGSPAAGAVVWPSLTSDFKTYSGNVLHETITPADGSFEFSGVPSDRRLVLYVETPDRKMAGTASLDVTKQRTVTVRLLPTVPAEVLLTDGRKKLWPRLKVEVRPKVDGQEVWQCDRTATTDADGRLKVGGILPGQEYLVADARYYHSATRQEDGFQPVTLVLAPLGQTGSATEPSTQPAPAAGSATDPPTTRPATQPAVSIGFGPVVERVVRVPSAKDDTFLDMEAGKLFAHDDSNAPKEPTMSKELSQTYHRARWAKGSGADICLPPDGRFGKDVTGLLGLDMRMLPTKEPFDRLTPRDAAKALAGRDFNMWNDMRCAVGKLPATFLVETREGHLGVVQVAGVSDDPPGLRVRYKMTPAPVDFGLEEPLWITLAPSEPTVKSLAALQVLADVRSLNQEAGRSGEWEIRTADNTRRVARLPYCWNIGPEQLLPDGKRITGGTDRKRLWKLDESQLRRVGAMEKGDYLLAWYVAGLRCSNVMPFRIDPACDSGVLPLLELAEVETGPGRRPPVLVIRARRHAEKDPAPWNLDVAHATLNVDGQDRTLSGFVWIGGDAPLRIGDHYTYLLDLKWWTWDPKLKQAAPPIDPNKPHVVFAKVGRDKVQQTPPIRLTYARTLGEAWDLATPKLAPVPSPEASISLSGSVFDLQGKPGANYEVTLAGGDGARFREKADAAGKYSFSRIPPGTYRLGCNPPGMGQPELTISGIVIQVGKTTLKDVSLAGKFILAGRVTDADGKPVPNMAVDLSCQDRQAGAEFMDTTQTDEQGRYRLASPLGTVTYVGVNGGRINGEMPRLSAGENAVDFPADKGHFRAAPAPRLAPGGAATQPAPATGSEPAPSTGSGQAGNGAAGKARVIRRVYDVRDLAVGIPSYAGGPAYWDEFDPNGGFPRNREPGEAESRALQNKTIERENEAQLIEKIKQIDPGSWLPEAGIGSITPLQDGKNLVISQTPENHAQISKLIEMLRDERSLQVRISFKFIRLLDPPAAGKSDALPDWLSKNVKSTFDEKTGLLRMSDSEAEALLEHVKSNADYTLLSSPRITLYNRQRAYVTVRRDEAIFLPRLDKKGEKALMRIPIGAVVDIQAVVDRKGKSIVCDLAPWLAERAFQADVPGVAVAEAKAAFTVPDKAAMLLRVEMVKHKIEGARQAVGADGAAKMEVQHSPVETGGQEKYFVYILISSRIIERVEAATQQAPEQPIPVLKPADAPRDVHSDVRVEAAKVMLARAEAELAETKRRADKGQATNVELAKAKREQGMAEIALKVASAEARGDQDELGKLKLAAARMDSNHRNYILEVVKEAAKSGLATGQELDSATLDARLAELGAQLAKANQAGDAVEQDRIRVQAAEVVLEHKEKLLARCEALRKRGAATDPEVEHARSEVKLAELTLRDCQAALAETQKRAKAVGAVADQARQVIGRVPQGAALQVGDEVEVFAQSDKPITARRKIAEDGTISLPGLDKPVSAEGAPVQNLAGRLAAAYGLPTQAESPVSVIVTARNPKRLYLNMASGTLASGKAIPVNRGYSVGRDSPVPIFRLYSLRLDLEGDKFTTTYDLSLGPSDTRFVLLLELFDDAGRLLLADESEYAVGGPVGQTPDLRKVSGTSSGVTGKGLGKKLSKATKYALWLLPAKKAPATQPALTGATTQPAAQSATSRPGLPLPPRPPAKDKAGGAKDEIARVYDIRDLIVPRQRYYPLVVGWLDSDAKKATEVSSAAPTAKEMREDLKDRIIKSVDKASWKEAGGQGAMKDLDGALVITQTAENQEKITKVINDLRRERSPMMQVEAKVITASPDAAGRLEDWLQKSVQLTFQKGQPGIFLSAEDANSFLSKAQSFSDVQLTGLPRRYFYLSMLGHRSNMYLDTKGYRFELPDLNQAGKSDKVSYRTGTSIDIQGVISPDGNEITMTFTVSTAKLTSEVMPVEAAAAKAHATISISDGHAFIAKAPLVQRQVKGFRRQKDPGSGELRTTVVEEPIPDRKPVGEVYVLIKPSIGHVQERDESKYVEEPRREP